MSVFRYICIVEIVPMTFAAIDLTWCYGPWWAFTFLIPIRCVIVALKGGVKKLPNKV